MVIGFFGLAMYGGTLVRMSLCEPANITPGTQDLPPIADIEEALLDTNGTGSFRTKAGQAELCMNRVYYSGKAVEKLLSLLHM